MTPTPPANAFVAEDRRAEPQPVYPLDVWFCQGCAHVQLLDVVDPRVLYEEYVYVSGTAPVFVAHFADYAATVIADFGLAPDDLVVDIGSNDGTLLRAFEAAGMRVLGVEPARDIAAAANAAGIETHATFFDSGEARAIRGDRGPARCITANNVLAHIDDLGGVIDGVRALLAADGVLVFEVSYLVDVYEQTLFDTIYHEHLDYHSLAPLVPFFEGHGMRILDARRTAAHGGSLRVFAQHRDAPPVVGTEPGAANVARLIALERRLGLDAPVTFQRYGDDIDRRGGELTALVRELRREGKRIAGFGAPAKATTLMYHFGLGADDIEFIVDDSPLKQGLYSPGLHIPIVSAAAIAREKPDYLVVLAWNFAASIMAKQQAFRDSGGHFIVPLPTLSVH